ncbi:hypothetical protein EYC59_02165 [Candidatus Saccharibacteria bacterium]|nr:MAG: hypothetical protein EYC59_02165 [Candidatus Saccharibacteria bacterium]
MSSFDTEEAGLAMWLMSLGYKLICMHPKSGTRHSIFHFVITSSIEKAVSDYYESKKASATEQFMAAMKSTLKAFEKEERNARKSK